MNIPVLKIPFSDNDILFIKQGMEEVLKSGCLTSGTYVKIFEEKFGKFCGCRYAVATNSGTSALEIILRAIDITGHSVIVPINTFLATALAVLHAGGKVIFADAMKENFCLDPNDLQRKIRGDTKAVILVHIGGIVSPYIDEIQKTCKENNLYLVEDAAHAHGSSFRGKKAGTFGIAGAFSFFPTKVLTCAEGGMVATNDDEIYEKAIILRNQGKNPKFENRITDLGHNWRMNELNAVLGVQQMNRSAHIISERRKAAQYYDDNLRKITGIKPLTIPEAVYSTYYKYIAYLEEGMDRLALKQRLKKEYDVSLTGEVYDVLCHEELLFKNNKELMLNSPDEKFPGADYISKRHVCLPVYPGLTGAELEYVVDSIKKVLNEMA